MSRAATQETNEVKRSYGLRRGKRIYEGYNAERKVKDRKTKEKQRLLDGMLNNV